jgi:hypothetical protein
MTYGAFANRGTPFPATKKFEPYPVDARQFRRLAEPRDTINSGNRTTPDDRAGFVIVTTCGLQMAWHAESQSVATQADV